MITETNFLAETFYAYSMISFLQEKSFHDLPSPGPIGWAQQSQAPSAGGPP
jgi:hypothetical protein